MQNEQTPQKVILVIGACALDRLLSVPTYPTADAKVRTSAYHEMGGGNAANTATAMALLSNASVFGSQFRVKLLSKVGDDHIGKQVLEELRADGVDLSLCRVDCGATTGVTTIVVSEDKHTRTCFHTPGTCGFQTLEELGCLDDVFQNVIHFHSDSRNTTVALALAREARVRGIPVSVDLEKDRVTKALDELLELTTTVFTNSNQMEEYLSRLIREKEEQHGNYPLQDPTIVAPGVPLSDADIAIFARAIRPSAFFSQWYDQNEKEVVITRGEEGALHIQCESVVVQGSQAVNQIKITACSEDNLSPLRIEHRYTESPYISTSTFVVSTKYIIHSVGVLSDATVVDTTGAGDAFIGAFLMARLLPLEHLQTCLAMGSWVGGRKVSGPGARTALPRAAHVDEVLGLDREQVQQSLSKLVGPFRTPTSKGIEKALFSR
jgi:sugar/nucleoside kinase (ribokinase family)